MSKRAIFLGMSMLVSVAIPGSISAQTGVNSAAACQAFANYGGVFSNYILPMSLKDFAAMNSGKNQGLIDGAISKLDRDVSGADKLALNALGTENKALFEEAAINLAIDIVMSGDGPTSTEVANIMRQECQTAGANQIIEYQKSLYAQQSTGQTDTNQQ